MRLEAARTTVDGAGELIDRTTEELRAAIAEVRDLARGRHPTILTEAGLRAAIEALAERTPIPIHIDVPERRFAPSIEATAYFVVAEALTNVVRYAAATLAQVRATVAAGDLIVEVRDDGRGGADTGRGSGLRGLEDRLSTVGGGNARGDERARRGHDAHRENAACGTNEHESRAPVRVVLADDAVLLREALAAALIAAGFHVVGQAAGVPELLGLVKQLEPDVNSWWTSGCRRPTRRKASKRRSSSANRLLPSVSASVAIRRDALCRRSRSSRSGGNRGTC